MNEGAEALAQATRITETMHTEGWSLLRKVLEDQIEGLDSVQGIATIKDLLARKTALKALRAFLADLDAIRDAKTTYVASTVMQKVKDPIYKLL